MRIVRSLQILVLALALATVGVGTAELSAPSDATAAASSSRPEVRAVATSFESEVLRYTNAARKRNGLRPLVAAGCIDHRANRWARIMAARDNFRHQPMRSVMRACDRRYVGENIAMGSSLTPRQVVRLWLKSPGHRKNIMNRKYRRLGVGAFRSADSGRIYVAQNFSK